MIIEKLPKEAPVRTNLVYIKPIAVTGQNFMGQTSRFPTMSSKGNTYIMICYEYDSNITLAEPLKSRSTVKLIRAYTK